MRVTALGLLRTAGVVGCALLVATILPRLGVPARWVPDLVLIAVVSTAVLRGPVHGALVGLAAGWVVELIPPVGRPLGLVALTMMLGGAVAGALPRDSRRALTRPLAALLLAALVVGAGRIASAIAAEGHVEVLAVATVVGSTVVAGAVVLPVLVGIDRALVRRRLG